MGSDKKKQDVREFYDAIGWRLESDGHYQNARYEDLRPVSAEYIHKCHMRITPNFLEGGKYFMDLGSGPIQYKEYFTYSKYYEKRVCVDISITALIEARKRIGEQGLFVVADAAHLPFWDNVFDGIVSLHTLHHLPLEDQEKAWVEIHRTLAPGRRAVVVNGWTESLIMEKWRSKMQIAEKIGLWIARLRGKETASQKIAQPKKNEEKPAGTFVQKLDADWIRAHLSQLGDNTTFQIRCWRSVNVRWLRAFIHPPFGKYILRALFRKEEARAEYFGEYGQYPMIILKKGNDKRYFMNTGNPIESCKESCKR